MPELVGYPPASPPDPLPSLTDASIDHGWRIQRPGDPLKPTLHARGKWRFDAPNGEWTVTYMNRSQIGAFAEVFAGRGEIGPDDADRRLLRLNLDGSAQVVALQEPETLTGFGLDSNISTTRTYARTMLWGAKFRSWYETAQGISYLGRQAGAHTNYCFWLDRCAGILSYEELGRLGELRELVLDMCDRLHLAPRIFDPSGPSGWIA